MDTMTGMNWSKGPSWGLLIAGIAQLVVGIAFIASAMAFGSILSFFYPLAIFEFALGAFLIFLGVRARSRVAAAQQLKATGVAGQAAILGLRQTGVYMNEQPQVEMTLQVSVPGREPFTVTRKEYVPLMLIGTLTSGRPLPVKVDPNDPQTLVIEWESALSMPAAGAAGMAGMAGGQGVIVGKDVAATPDLVAQAGAAGLFPSETELQYKRTRLRQFGKDGSAVVQSAQDTGQMVGRYKLFIVDLIVTIDGVAKDVPASAAAVDPADAPKVVAGMLVPIKYDATNPDDMTLLWDEARLPS